MNANSHPNIAEASGPFIATAVTFYDGTVSVARTTNDGLYNDVHLGLGCKSVNALKDSSLLMKAIQMKHAVHKPSGGRTNKMMLFEVDDRIGFHADSASQSIQNAKKTKGQVNRVVLYWSVDNDPETKLAKFVVRNKGDKDLADNDAGGPDSIKVVLDRKHLSATSMTDEAARFGKTKSGDRIYHGTTRAPARTIAWAGDLTISLKQFLEEVDRTVLALKQQQPKLAAAIPACKDARRTAPSNGDTKKNNKHVIPRPKEPPKKRQKKKE
jgi:hypothetical protein